MLLALALGWKILGVIAILTGFVSMLVSVGIAVSRMWFACPTCESHDVAEGESFVSVQGTAVVHMLRLTCNECGTAFERPIPGTRVSATTAL